MYTVNVNVPPHLRFGLQVLGFLSTLAAVSRVLSFTFDTFLRTGASVGTECQFSPYLCSSSSSIQLRKFGAKKGAWAGVWFPSLTETTV